MTTAWCNRSESKLQLLRWTQQNRMTTLATHGASLFRRLAHLAVFHGTEVDVLQMILERVEGLKVFIWLSNTVLRLEETPETLPREIEDDRVVALECPYVKDWEDGARGKDDMWTFAEMIVKDRLA